jgi:AcrR family transcriptional regulator
MASLLQNAKPILCLAATVSLRHSIDRRASATLMKDLDSLTALLWNDPTPPKRGPRPTLSLPIIARAGIEIAQEGGLAAVTMEAVAQRLGLTKMALYRYVPGKAELVAVMVENALGAPSPTPRAKSWRNGLHAWAHALSAKFSQHPWSLEATLGARAMGPNELAWLESALSALSDTGLRGADKLDVVVTVIGHIRHLVQQVPTGSSEQVERALLGVLRKLVQDRSAQFPSITAVLSERATKSSEGAALDFGLDCILDGVEARIADRSRKARRRSKPDSE